MNDLEREKREGLSWRYLADVPIMKALVGNRYRTPGFGLAAQLFACTARSAVARLGPEEGETVLKEAVQAFGKERGRRIAATVQGLGKPLTLKNWDHLLGHRHEQFLSGPPDPKRRTGGPREEMLVSRSGPQVGVGNRGSILLPVRRLRHPGRIQPRHSPHVGNSLRHGTGLLLVPLLHGPRVIVHRGENGDGRKSRMRLKTPENLKR